MKAVPECIFCNFRQALNTARIATDDHKKQADALRLLCGKLKDCRLDISPAALSQDVYACVAEATGVRDPFEKLKKSSNKAAMALLPDIKGTMAAAGDKLKTALRAAVAGNVIDLGIGHEYDLEADLRRIMASGFAIDATEEFRAEIAAGKKLLYLCDNAGEIAFDTILIGFLLSLGLKVKAVVKSGPIINDATMEDAEVVGLTKLVEVMETGSDDIGVSFTRASPAFLEAFTSADLILGKGHGNFETTDERPENIFHLLKAKCPVVAEELGCRLGNVVFTRCSARRGSPSHIGSSFR